MRDFPILETREGGYEREGRLESIPWDLIGSHEDQAQANHSQSLRRLAVRGGLSCCEVLAVLYDKPWQDLRALSERDAEDFLRGYVDQYGRKRAPAPDWALPPS